MIKMFSHLIIIGLTLLPPGSLMRADEIPPPSRREIYQYQVNGYINQWNPRLKDSRVRTLSRIIGTASDTFDVDPKVLTYILIQESSLKSGIRAGDDLGIAQINCPTWCDYLNLDPHRLQYDDEYNIMTAARILSDLKREYGHEKRYWSRYHNFKPRFRIVYEKLVASRMIRG